MTFVRAAQYTGAVHINVGISFMNLSYTLLHHIPMSLSTSHILQCLQYVDVGHKKHLEHCSGSRKRKQGETPGHVEIEGLAELEAEEEEQMQGSAADADTKPAKVIPGLMLCLCGDPCIRLTSYLCCSNIASSA